MSAQDWEAEWWGPCTNTFGEEAKQITYAHRMGLVNEPHLGKWPVYDLDGRSVLDLGGGPTSMLLKTRNGGTLTVVDPCPYPDWVVARYEHSGIEHVRHDAETFTSEHRYDECWIYNVLQHVIDPELVIDTARAHADTLRIFEWVGMETDIGHPHSLEPSLLDEWIGGTGTVTWVDENGATGTCYHGTFAL